MFDGQNHPLNPDTLDEIPSSRALIVQSAIRLFANQGYNGVSMREIADQSKMTKAALYYHFQSKADLLQAIFVTYQQEFSENLQKIHHLQAPARQKISELVKSIMAESPDRLSVIHLLFIESQHLENEIRQEIGQKYHQLFLGSLEALLTEAAQQEEIHPVDVRLAAQMLFGMMYLHFHPRQQKSTQEMERITALILRIFFEGLQTKACG